MKLFPSALPAPYIFSTVSFESAEQDGERYRPRSKTCALLPESRWWTTYLFSFSHVKNHKDLKPSLRFETRRAVEAGLADVRPKYSLRLLPQGLPPHRPVLRAVLWDPDEVPARLALLWFIRQSARGAARNRSRLEERWCPPRSSDAGVLAQERRQPGGWRAQVASSG